MTTSAVAQLTTFLRCKILKLFLPVPMTRTGVFFIKFAMKAVMPRNHFASKWSDLVYAYAVFLRFVVRRFGEKPLGDGGQVILCLPA